MKHTRVPLVLGLLVGVALIAPGTTPISAAHARSGVFHVQKECPDYKGLPGQFCTFTFSDIPEITVGSKVFYTQPIGVPAGLLDSNVVLDAGDGNRALGRCTLDLDPESLSGLCTFSDGTGHFTGFNARIEVFTLNQGRSWWWLGTYEFSRESVKGQPRPK